MTAFGSITSDKAMLLRLARAEWENRYSKFVDATNQKDARGRSLLKWPKGMWKAVLQLEENFDTRTASEETLNAYAKLVQPIYPDLKPLNALLLEVKTRLAARYSRADFVPTVPAVRGFDRKAWAEAGPFYHGTRAFDKILRDGVCSAAISNLTDSDVIGTSPPLHWWEGHGSWGSPPMSAVLAAQNRGYDFGYSWLGYWRTEVFQWYAALSAEDRAIVSRWITGRDGALPIRTKQEKDSTADVLGDLTLFFITERRSTAESYGRASHADKAHAVLEVNPAFAQAFDIITDDLQGESSYALIIPPGVCPQIDWRGLKYEGSSLGGLRR